MSLIYIDLETVGTDDPAIIAEIASTITPPGNYKKPETIAAWEQGEKRRAVEEAVAKTCFDGGYGKIVCACFAVDDGNVWTITDTPETRLIKTLFDGIVCEAGADVTLVGHNITWDLRMLYQRAVVHGIEPPPVLLKAMRARPWDDCIADTMTLWHPDRDRKISLDKLCKILGVQSSKSEMNGSMVAQYYKEGRLDEISNYCKLDVEAVRACYKRLSFATV